MSASPPPVLARRFVLRGGVAVALWGLLPAVFGPPPNLTVGGRLRVVGSKALEPLVERWLSLFRLQFPVVDAHAALYGSGLSIGAFASGWADVAVMTRPLLPQEQAQLSARLEPAAIEVGALSSATDPPLPIFLYLLGGVSGNASLQAVTFARLILTGDGQQQLRTEGLHPLPVDRRGAAEREIETARRQAPLSWAT